MRSPLLPIDILRKSVLAILGIGAVYFFFFRANSKPPTETEQAGTV